VDRNPVLVNGKMAVMADHCHGWHPPQLAYLLGQVAAWASGSEREEREGRREEDRGEEIRVQIQERAVQPEAWGSNHHGWCLRPHGWS
jgi:hypothetical protein